MPDPDDVLALGAKNLGERLQRLREEAGLTRRELSNLSGVAYESLYSVEAGRRLANLSTLYRLAKAFELSTVEILSDVEPWARET